jgi:uncharacterized protein HemX
MSNNNYLWDKSGEPDPEIEELEQILATLRYQPRPFQVPKTISFGRRLTSNSVLAIAAAVAMVVLGLGIWLSLNQKKPNASSASYANQKREQPMPNAAPPKNETVVKEERSVSPAAEQQTIAQRPAESRANQRRRFTTPGSAMLAKQRSEAENGKRQLMLALRVASAKLNLAQRRAQNVPGGNLIRNQHKVG